MTSLTPSIRRDQTSANDHFYQRNSSIALPQKFRSEQTVSATTTGGEGRDRSRSEVKDGWRIHERVAS